MGVSYWKKRERELLARLVELGQGISNLTLATRALRMQEFEVKAELERVRNELAE